VQTFAQISGTYCDKEIVMLIQQQHVDIPLFDTTSIHAEEAVLEALR
jgi:aspartate/glutamate racemase